MHPRQFPARYWSRTYAPNPLSGSTAARNWKTNCRPAPHPGKPDRALPGRKSSAEHWCPSPSRRQPAHPQPLRATQNAAPRRRPRRKQAGMSNPQAPTESGQSGRRILVCEESFVYFFVPFWGAVLLHRFRAEPDDGADIVLRLSTPRALDWRASNELSGPPNALTLGCSRTSGAGRLTGGRLTAA